MRAILPAISIEDRRHRLTALFSATLAAALQRSRPLCVLDKGRPVGVALFHPPGTPAPPVAAQLRIVIKTVSRAGPYGLGRWSIWMRKIKPYRPQEPHYYLEQLGVEPRIQGQGVGSLLLQALTKQADRGNRACFLETANPRNLPLYDRFGFHVIAESGILGVPTWFLRRPPSNAFGSVGYGDQTTGAP